MKTPGTGRLAITIDALENLRRSRAHDLLLIAIAWMTIPCLSAIVLAAIADRICSLPVWGRVTACLFCLSCITAAIFWLVRFSRRKLSLQALATLVEKARPSADNRIINAIQFAEGGVQDLSFIEALLSESPVRVEQVMSKELYSPKPVLWLKRSLPLAILVWLIPFAISPMGMLTSLARIAMPFSRVAPYSQTIIAKVTPGDIFLKRGQELDIAVTLSGDMPSKATIHIDDNGSSPEILAMERSENKDFHARTSPIFSSIRYRVEAGDAVSEWFHAKVAPVPGLVRWEAAVASPPHTKRQNYLLKNEMEKMEIMPGSTMIFAGLATMPLASIEVLQGDKSLAASQVKGQKQFDIKAVIPNDTQVKLKIISTDGVEAVQPLPLTFLPDKPPTIVLVDTPTSFTVANGHAIPVAFNANDDFGVTKVGLERMPQEFAKNEQVSNASPEGGEALSFTGRFVIDTGSFTVERGENLTFRLWVEDNSPARRRSYSPAIQVNFPDEESAKDAKNTALRQAEEGLGAIIKKQRTNLKDTRQIADLATEGKEIPHKRLEIAGNEQTKIREMAVAILQNRTAFGGLGDTLSSLVNLEMKDAIDTFAAIFRSTDKNKLELLRKCEKIQNTILATLTGVKEGMTSEQEHQDKSDIFAALQKLIKLQRDNFKDTEAASTGKAIVTDALIHNQDRAAQTVLSFSNLCLAQADQRTADDFAEQLRKAHSVLSKDEAYEQALGAAEALDAKDFKTAIECQRKVMKSLFTVLDILNKWRVNNAKSVLESATEVINNVKNKLGELEEKQAKIAEVTRDMKSRGPLTDETREKLAEMDKEQEEMKDMVEQLANDLYQFPELPVCNELNAKMREVFEDVLQALDSENLPSIEIAVQKEDGLLDAIRNTKERIEDVEMWLPDVPDHFVWNMESFDTDEFPEIPLVDLPEELEDLVGELLEQEENIDAQSQDTTGNNIVADAEMGWAVLDGPMPSFSAKGKSGNTRPNDNEMTGRSGAGREGQATGELVENHVKGYEGRQTHARRTQDQFQKGMVTEDKDSTLDARATGGGKLGGESESIGMFGNAPRRDLHTAAHGQNQQKLRQEAEVLYASARLLYIGTGGLGEAARDLRAIEKAPPDIRTLGSLRRRVLRRLEDCQVESKGGAVLPMPVSSVTQTGGSAVDDSDLEKLSDEYKPLLNEYYKGLAQ